MRESKEAERKDGGRKYLWFRDLQIPYLDTTRCEIGDLEFDVDGPFRFAGSSASHATSKATGHTAAVFVVALNGGQAELGAHEELLAAAELLDLPDDGGLFGGVVDGSDVGSETGRVGVFRHGDDDFDVVGRAATFELGLGLEVEILLDVGDLKGFIK